MRAEGPVLWRLCNILRKKRTMQLIWALDSHRAGVPEVTLRSRHFLNNRLGFPLRLSRRSGPFENHQSRIENSPGTSVKKMIKLSATAEKTSCIVSFYGYGFIIVGALHMCFRSNRKSQAYVNFCKKIIYPSTSLYKVCSKKEYLSLGTKLLLSPRKERGGLSQAPQWLPQPSSEKLWFRQVEPRSGPKSLDTTQHAITSRRRSTHVSVREQGLV